ncbi:MAG: hypothetical protein ACRD1G_04465, partial [Acidimicrobiales bacterium]
PWGDGKTSVRAGYSISFINDEAIVAASNASGNNPGLIAPASVINLQSNSISGNSGAGLLAPPAVAVPRFGVPATFAQNRAAFGSPQAGFAIDPNLRTPYVGEWNLSVQRDLGHQTSITVSYLGNKGTALTQVLDYNQVTIGSNGILADFNRARSNGFLALAKTGSFNPNFNASIPGSQQLTVIPNLCLSSSQAGCTGSRSLTSGSVVSLLQTGQVGEFVNTYFSNNASGTVALTPSPLISVGDVLQNHASSIYHAGSVELRRRFNNGLTFQANYTYSKVLTNSDGSQTNVDPLLDNAQPTIERARASYDLTNGFKANFDYGLPVGKGYALNPGNAWVRTLVSGWRTTSIFTWQSGSPFSI